MSIIHQMEYKNQIDKCEIVKPDFHHKRAHNMYIYNIFKNIYN